MYEEKKKNQFSSLGSGGVEKKGRRRRNEGRVNNIKVIDDFKLVFLDIMLPMHINTY